jgi:site-specific recombinase XerD
VPDSSVLRRLRCSALGFRHGRARTRRTLFVDRRGRPLSRGHACRILHRLSVRAGLPRKIGPHALRHYAATSILKQTGGLELVRQVLRHESLAMALRYAQMTKPEVSRKFRRASPLDNFEGGEVASRKRPSVPPAPVWVMRLPP